MCFDWFIRLGGVVVYWWLGCCSWCCVKGHLVGTLLGFSCVLLVFACVSSDVVWWWLIVADLGVVGWGCVCVLFVVFWWFGLVWWCG